MRPIIAALAAIVGTAIANSHVHHQHLHHKKTIITEEVSVTVVECWLNGQKISESACKAGIDSGKLKWAEDGTVYAPSTTTIMRIKTPPTPAPKPKPVPLAVPPPALAVHKVAPKPHKASSPHHKVTPAPHEAPPKPPSPPPALPPLVTPPKAAATAPAVKPVPKPVKSVPDSGSHESDKSRGADTPFPDGELDCSEFPSSYGAVPLPWLGLNGWAAVQKPTLFLPHGYSNILSMTKNECEDGNCCVERSYCSYACGEGLLKWQWPSMQGAEGQSVGGLLCKDGKLHLTNPSVPTLCAPGNDKVKVKVKNKLEKNVAICLTNYPADEKMSIPLDVLPGTTKRLACPDADKFYKTRNGAGTSAQYYINLPGYSIQKACSWGEPTDDFGNFAPANIGVGIRDGVAYVSIFRNYPSQPTANLTYTVTIEGGNIPCRYHNGQICRGEGYTICETEGNAGCTVGASSGTVTFVLSD